jgi:hypothetical protein
VVVLYSEFVRTATSDCCTIGLKVAQVTQKPVFVGNFPYACEYRPKTKCIIILLVAKPEGKRSLGRPGRRWVDNVRMDLGEVGWGDVDWVGLAQDRNRWRAVVNSVLNLWVPCNAGKLSSGLTSSGFSSSAQLHRIS